MWVSQQIAAQAFFFATLNRNLIATKSAFSRVRKSKIELHACG